jgi:peptide/nickel transport system substrate-binding protein
VTRFKFIILPCLLVLLTACSDSHDDVIRFGLTRLPITLDPRFATDAASSRVNRLLYQRLVDFDDSANPVPALGEWKFVTPKRCRFHLRDRGRRFSDGTYLTARDVKATYMSVLDKDTASPLRISLANIRAIDVIDDDTLDFELNEPDILFPGRLLIGILPAKQLAADHPFNRRPVGSGPFAVVGWEGDSRLRLQRRRDKQLFEFVAVADPTVRVLKLLRGEIDMLQNDLPPEMITYLENDDRVIVSRRAGSNFAYLGFNLTDPLTGQQAIRQAIAYALDRQAIITYVLGNAARPANALLPPSHWAGNPDLHGYDHDPGKARQLLQQVGYNRAHPLQLTYKTSSDPFRLRLATIIQQQLADVGIDVELRSYDWGTFYGDIKAGRFQMYSLMWVGIKLPDIFRYAFYSESIPPAGANRGRLIDARVDELIETAEKGGSLAQQADSYRQLQAYLLRLLPYVPLWYEDHVFVSRTSIHGYHIASDGNYDGLMTVTRDTTGQRHDER